MSESDRNGDIARGIIVGFLGAAFFFVFLGLPLFLVDVAAQNIPDCSGTTDDCGNNSQEMPDRWYWLRRAFAVEDTIAQWIMMVFTVAAAVLILFTLRATQKMASDTRRIGEKQTRAYIAVDVAEYEMPEIENWSHLDGIKAKIIIRNFGNSPAFIRRVSRVEKNIGSAIQDSINMDDALEGRQRGGTGVIGPQSGFTIAISNILNEEAFESLKSRDIYSFFIGRIEYLDVFDAKRVYEFAMRVENFGTDRVSVFPYGDYEKST